MTAADEQKPVVDLAAAAELVQERLGVSLSELVAAANPRRVVPTFAEYVLVVRSRTSARSVETWSSYWQLLVSQWGGRRIDEPTLAEIKELAEVVRQRARLRAGAKDGRGAMANFIDATNNLYNHARADKYVTVSDSPAAELKKSPRRNSPRHALSTRQVDELNATAAVVGLDPDLDTLLLRLHTETACRIGGVLALRRCDLNQVLCTVRLREKNDTTRDQPVSPTLMAALVAHHEQRNPGGQDDDVLLRTRNGRALRKYYYSDLWTRFGRHLPWVAALGVTSHWLRYTTLTWVERNFGYSVAAAYAGHAPKGGRTGATHTYVQATIEEVAAALAALTGEPHPLAAIWQSSNTGRDSLPAELGPGPESGASAAPLGVLEALVQRRVDAAGRISVASRYYSLGSQVARTTVDVHVYTGRYLVQLPDGRILSFPRPPGSDQVSAR